MCEVGTGVTSTARVCSSTYSLRTRPGPAVQSCTELKGLCHFLSACSYDYGLNVLPNPYYHSSLGSWHFFAALLAFVASLQVQPEQDRGISQKVIKWIRLLKASVYVEVERELLNLARLMARSFSTCLARAKMDDPSTKKCWNHHIAAQTPQLFSTYFGG